MPPDPPAVEPDDAMGRQAPRPPLKARLRYRLMKPFRKQWFATPSPSVRLADAEVIELGKREWVSVHTPGHTPDHLCLFDPAGGVLLSGDHVLPTITPHISGIERVPIHSARSSRHSRRSPSSKASRSHFPRTAIPSTTCAAGSRTSSGTTKSGSARLREATNEIGEGTVEQLSQRLFRQRSWGPMAESETYAHLEHLRLSGQANERGQRTARSITPSHDFEHVTNIRLTE